MLKSLKIMLWILLVLQCGFIFYNSAQPAKQSAKVSQSVTAKIVKTIPAVRKAAPDTQKKIIKNSESYVRKTAHFGLFLILGILAFLCADGTFPKNSFWFAFVFCLAYAISDEVHQLFVAGRACEIRDICIDFAGSFTGMLGTQLIKRRRMKK